MKEICKRIDNYTMVALHPGVFQVSLFIFFTTGKVWRGHVLITYAIDGEVNHDEYSTHNKGKSRGKCIYEWCIITNH